MPDGRAHLASRFTFGGPALYFPRARLYADHLELSGWQLRGRYHRTIPLEHILQIDATDTKELLLWLADGKTLRLYLSQPYGWKVAIEAHQALLFGRAP